MPRDCLAPSFYLGRAVRTGSTLWEASGFNEALVPVQTACPTF